jgi:hypothetical protein
MTLDASGNLGVGTTSPANRLHVYSTSGITDPALIETNQIFSTLAFKSTTNTSTVTFGIDGAGECAIENKKTSGNIVFVTKNSGGTSAERARITAAGEFVVGATTSAYTSSGRGVIEVNGSSQSLYGFRTGGTARGYLLHEATNLIISNDVSTGALTFQTNATERARITAGGDVGINTTSPLAKLDVRQTVDSTGTFFYKSDTGTAAVMGVRHDGASGATSRELIGFQGSGGTGIGSITGTGSATTYNTSSDRRLKENIAPADDAGAIIDAIQIVKHDWVRGGSVRYGAIAQDLNNVVPEAVTPGNDGEEIEKTWGVDYSKLVPMLVKEIQSLRARVAQLESK